MWSGMRVIDSLTREVFEKITDEAIKVTNMIAKNTLDSRAIQTGVRLILPGELAKHAVSEGTKAVTKACASNKYNSMGAGLQFPVGHIRVVLRERARGLRVGRGAPIYLAAVMEYMVAEVLELSGNASRDNQKVRIIPRHVMLAVHNDVELCSFHKGTIPQGGVMPHINAAMLPKSKSGAKFDEDDLSFGAPVATKSFGGFGFGSKVSKPKKMAFNGDDDDDEHDEEEDEDQPKAFGKAKPAAKSTAFGFGSKVSKPKNSKKCDDDDDEEDEEEDADEGSEGDEDEKPAPQGAMAMFFNMMPKFGGTQPSHPTKKAVPMKKAPKTAKKFSKFK